MAGAGKRSLPPDRLGEIDSFCPEHVPVNQNRVGINQSFTQWRTPPLSQAEAMQQFSWQQSGLAARNVLGIGVAAPTIADASGAATIYTDGTGLYAEARTTAVAATLAHFVAPAVLVQTRWDPAVFFSLNFDANTTMRAWVGLFSGDPSGAAAPAVALAGFRFDTGAGDTTWRAFTDTTGGTSPTEATYTGGSPLTAPVVNGREVFGIVSRSQGTIIEFYRRQNLNNGDTMVFVGRSTTDLPTTSTSLFLRAGLTSLGAIRNIRLSRMGAYQI